MHGLRHYFASGLIAASCDVVTVNCTNVLIYTLKRKSTSTHWPPLLSLRMLLRHTAPTKPPEGLMIMLFSLSLSNVHPRCGGSTARGYLIGG